MGKEKRGGGLRMEGVGAFKCRDKSSSVVNSFQRQRDFEVLLKKELYNKFISSFKTKHKRISMHQLNWKEVLFANIKDDIQYQRNVFITA